jgi:DNA-binding NarL/FixJ family response regulator
MAESVTMAGAKTLIVDDDARLRRCIRNLLDSAPDIEFIGEATSGPEALDMMRKLRPDLVLMDVRMPGSSGLDTTVQIKREMPQVQVIILTTYDLPEYRDAAIDSGASGYVAKREMAEGLIPTIRDIRARQFASVAEPI